MVRVRGSLVCDPPIAAAAATWVPTAFATFATFPGPFAFFAGLVARLAGAARDMTISTRSEYSSE